MPCLGEILGKTGDRYDFDKILLFFEFGDPYKLLVGRYEKLFGI
jgi:hypothetical protein